MPGGWLTEGFLDLLFFVSEIDKNVLGETYGVLFGEVDPTIVDDGLQLLDGRVSHPDHRLGFPQGLCALRVGEGGAAVQPLPVFLEVLYEVPDAHAA